MSALKKAEDSEGYVVRLFNPKNETIITTISVPALCIKQTVEFKHHKVQSYRIKLNEILECNILD